MPGRLPRSGALDSPWSLRQALPQRCGCAPRDYGCDRYTRQNMHRETMRLVARAGSLHDDLRCEEMDAPPSALPAHVACRDDLRLLVQTALLFDGYEGVVAYGDSTGHVRLLAQSFDGAVQLLRRLSLMQKHTALLPEGLQVLMADVRLLVATRALVLLAQRYEQGDVRAVDELIGYFEQVGRDVLELYVNDRPPPTRGAMSPPRLSWFGRAWACLRLFRDFPDNSQVRLALCEQLEAFAPRRYAEHAAVPALAAMCRRLASALRDD